MKYEILEKLKRYRLVLCNENSNNPDMININDQTSCTKKDNKKNGNFFHSRKKKEKMHSENEDTEDIIFGL